MKTLIVEDDFTSRVFLQELVKGYGPIHIAVNGKEAIDAVSLSLETGEPYDLICLDIMMPEMDGHSALKEIRALEDAKEMPPDKRAKIFMTSSKADRENVMEAIKGHCDYFLAKPFDRKTLIRELKRFKLIM